jgi:hypothetical protein
MRLTPNNAQVTRAIPVLRKPKKKAAAAERESPVGTYKPKNPGLEGMKIILNRLATMKELTQTIAAGSDDGFSADEILSMQTAIAAQKSEIAEDGMYPFEFEK